MSRSSTARKPSAPKPTPAPVEEKSEPKRADNFRETVEAVVGAVLLAILIRGFEAEAFVIPTGSMAPTLMGRHKEIACPQCGFVYSVNASEEVEGVKSGSPDSLKVASGTCVNCRFQADLSQEPSFKGDRILVNKMVYDTPSLPGGTDLRRWDVVVFRFPEEPEVNYIKRLVGLPGEGLRLWYGDVYIRKPAGTDFEIARKPLEHQAAMQMMVNDDRLRPLALKEEQAWKRWTPTEAEAWTEDVSNPGHYKASAKAGEWSELTYQHKVPDPGQWLAINTDEPLPREPRATLITDFSSYNTNLSAANADLNGKVGYEQETAWFQPHWVGDLTISGAIALEKGEGRARIELIEGGVSNRAEFDLATGTVSILRGETKLADGPTPLKGIGSHSFQFANVDNRLTLWIDGNPIFGEGLTYEDDPEAHPSPTPADLKPVRIGAEGASIAVSDLVLKRDIYYTLKPGTSDFRISWKANLPMRPVELFDLLADPDKYTAMGPLKQGSVYAVGEDRYMMMGDNSPRSRDGRDWRETDRYDPDDPDYGWDKTNRKSWEVPRNLVTGKAFAVFWPHGVPFWPNIKISQDFRFPFRPYFERMKWIR